MNRSFEAAMPDSALFPSGSPFMPIAGGLHTPIPEDEEEGVSVNTTFGALGMPSFGVAPPTPEKVKSTAQAQVGAVKVDLSAVSPKFATATVLPDVHSAALHLNAEEAENDSQNATLSVERSKRSGAPSPSPHLETADALLVALGDTAPETPTPAPLGPPSNVEMYQHASLPPLPVKEDIETASEADTDAVFATAPDTPAHETVDGDDEGDRSAVDLPELSAFLGRVQMSSDAADDADGTASIASVADKRASQQTFGTKDRSDWRSSVHTFGGTQSEAAWLAAGSKASERAERSRLSLDNPVREDVEYE
jgi:hypothetical protein